MNFYVIQGLTGEMSDNYLGKIFYLSSKTYSVLFQMFLYVIKIRQPKTA